MPAAADTVENFRIRITRRNGVRALVPDCSFLLRECAEQYAAKYIPKYQKAEIVAFTAHTSRTEA